MPNFLKSLGEAWDERRSFRRESLQQPLPRTPRAAEGLPAGRLGAEMQRSYLAIGLLLAPVLAHQCGSNEESSDLTSSQSSED